MTALRSILLVEDNEDDVFLMERAVNAAQLRNPMQVVEDGQEAVNYLSGKDKFSDRALYPVPSLIFLDLKLPIKRGFEVLEWLRQLPEYKDTSVVVLTSSNETADIAKAYALGANSYLVKPPTGAQLRELAASFRWDWLQFGGFGSL